MALTSRVIAWRDQGWTAELCGHGIHVFGRDGRDPVPLHQLFDQVGLPVERVRVVPRLLGEPEAEEVGSDGSVLGLHAEQQAPVVRARGEAVEEEKQRIAAASPEEVDAAAAELLV